MRRLLALALLVGCAESLTTAETDTGAPLVGVDGSVDQADRSCHVVLRDLARNWTGFTWEAVTTSTGTQAYVWQGTLEISVEAHAEGLVPAVVYQSGSDPTWREAIATPAAVAPTAGFARFTVRLSEGLPGPGMSATALQNTKIRVAPFVRLAGGGRLFDHNRNRGDFDDYVVAAPDFAIASAPAVCAPAVGPQRGTLTFAADHSETRTGVLVPGGEVAIAYDPARLTTCRHSQGGNPLWDLTAHVRFTPGGEQVHASVRDSAAVFAIPPAARGIEVWFENTSASGCQAWDSNFGANYAFAIATPPQWVGEVQTRLTRTTDDPCSGGNPAGVGFAFDTWTRQRAAITNVCFQVYEPGLTDRDDPDLWQKLDVQLKWRHAGEPAWRASYAQLDRRLGNNARYAFDLRAIDPLRMYHCPDVTPVAVPNSNDQYVQVAIEYYVVVNGAETRPAPGEAFHGVFIDHADDLYRSQHCEL